MLKGITMKTWLAVCVQVVLLCSAGLALAGDPKVDCENKSWNNNEPGAPNSKTNQRDPGQKIKWEFKGKGGTKVLFEILDYNGGAPQSPLEKTDLEFDKTLHWYSKSLKKEIKQGALHGKYTYKITCVYKDGSTAVIDPIIEVPRSQRETDEEQSD